MSSQTWIVELTTSERQSVDCSTMGIVDGHLRAARWGDDLVAAWSPGQWVRFWPKVDDGYVERLSLNLSAFEQALATAADDDDRAYFAMTAEFIRCVLAETERLAA